MHPWIIALIVIFIVAFIAAVIVFFITQKKKNTKIEEENRRLELDNLEKRNQNKILLDKQIQFQTELSNLQKQKQELESWIEESEEEQEELKSSISDKRMQEIELRTLLDSYKNEINRTKEIASDTQQHWQNLARDSFSTYCDQLEFSYQNKEKEYEDKVIQLNTNFEMRESEVAEEIAKIKADLEKIRSTRAAAVEAMVRDEEIKQKADFYCPTVSKADLADIEILESIKPRLNNPRILSMLIWSTYYQKRMTALCNNILGLNTVCGIYKITNQLNNMCYIGQSTDLEKRWKDHAKCGLGIDTPQGNKLYAAMIKDGLYNFSFELLEKCPREELNEKEKYYIELYQSKDYGYNTTGGNSK